MKGYPFSIQLPIQWGDMDALGHVNNTVFFRWFESVRVAIGHKAGLLSTPPGESGPIVAHTGCDYRKALRYPGDVTVGARVRRIGTTSIEMEYAIARVDTPAEIVATGRSIVVLVNYASGEKVPVPTPLRVALLYYHAQ